MTSEEKRWEDAPAQPLKYVMSDGTVVDKVPAAGEEITPNPNRKLAKFWEDSPAQPAKWVNSDGAIVDKMPTAGVEDEPVVGASEILKKYWESAPAQVSKYVNKEGEITESPSGGGSGSVDLSTCYVYPVYDGNNNCVSNIITEQQIIWAEPQDIPDSDGEQENQTQTLDVYDIARDNNCQPIKYPNVEFTFYWGPSGAHNAEFTLDGTTYTLWSI